MVKDGIGILEAGIKINNLIIPRKDVADFFRPLK